MRSPSASFLVTLVLALSWSPAAPAGEPAKDSGRLRRLLVQELLASDAPAHAPVAKTGPAAAPSEATEAVPTVEVGRSVAAVPTWPVIGLCVVLGAMLWWFKRGRSSRPGQVDIRRLATVPLGGKRGLALVEVMGERLLLGLADKQVNLLTRLAPGQQPSSPEVDPPKSPTVDEEFFERELRRLVDSRAREDLAQTGSLPPAAEQLELSSKLAGVWRD